jgi:hypothetical protein
VIRSRVPRKGLHARRFQAVNHLRCSAEAGQDADAGSLLTLRMMPGDVVAGVGAAYETAMNRRLACAMPAHRVDQHET